MEPGFSLRLDHDAVDLLARAGDGWEELGRADFADPELDGQLAELRDLAAALSPDGFATKLVLPASQILYTEADAPGPDDDARCRQIAGALEGRTPYSVEDLVFDWAEQDGTVRVAVVARDTLAEAEAFAEEHGFHPLCFAAAPDPDQFPREPSFGLTRSGAKLVDEGNDLVGRSEALGVVETDSTVDDPAAGTDDEAEAEDATRVDDLASAKPESDEPATATTRDTPEDASGGDVPDVEAAVQPEARDPDMVVSADVLPGEARPSPADHVMADRTERDHAETELGITAGLVPDDAEELSADGQTLSDPDDPLQDELDTDLGPEPASAGEAAEAPFIAVDDMPDVDETADLPELPVVPAAPAFASRRVGPAVPPGKPETPSLAARPSRFNLPGFGRSATDKSRGVTGADVAVDDTPAAEPRIQTPRVKAPRVPSVHLTDARHGTRAQLQARQKAAEMIPPPADREAGAFEIGLGLRNAPPLRLKLGLVLVAALLVLMALVGFGSLWFSDASAPSEPATVADAPAITEMTETAAESEVPTDVVAAASAPEVDQIAVAEPPADTTPPAPETTVTEDVALAAPDLSAPDAGTIWTSPPSTADTPPPSADVPPSIGTESDPGTDAAPVLSLLAPTTTSPDPGLKPQPVPPPPGTEYQFDANGFIVPTADGVRTPDGVTVFAGRPPVAPVARPAALLPATEPEPETPDPAPALEAEPEAAATSDPASPDAGPSDTGTAEDPSAPAEDAPLPAPVDPAHAALKPKPRPAALVAATEARIAQEEAEAEALAQALASATPQAVATSLRPRARPEGLRPVVIAATPAVDDAVAAAVAASLAVPEAPTQAAPQAAPEEEIDEPEPVSAAPNIPTTATVAKQATIKNAINLREISLIGIYGSSANRRALVRMPNGRYVKLKIGDRLDGGQVAAIGDSELSYIKRGKTIVLKILKNG